MPQIRPGGGRLPPQLRAHPARCAGTRSDCGTTFPAGARTDACERAPAGPLPPAESHPALARSPRDSQPLAMRFVPALRNGPADHALRSIRPAANIHSTRASIRRCSAARGQPSTKTRQRSPGTPSSNCSCWWLIGAPVILYTSSARMMRRTSCLWSLAADSGSTERKSFVQGFDPDAARLLLHFPAKLPICRRTLVDPAEHGLQVHRRPADEQHLATGTANLRDLLWAAST